MIQAEIGGAAKVDGSTGLQAPGFMIRDFTLDSQAGEKVQISSFRGRANLVLVFPADSDAMHAFLRDLENESGKFREEEAEIVVIDGRERRESSMPSPQNGSSILVLLDPTLTVYRLFGAVDQNGQPVPLVHVTDRFGEIVSTCVAPACAMPPDVGEILHTLEFLNQQCPECEPPEWPR